MLSVHHDPKHPSYYICMCTTPAVPAVQTAMIEVTPVRPLPLEVFTDLKALGRVALREGGRTVAVGIVTQIHE